MKKLAFLTAWLLLCGNALFAQIGFNNTGAQPDPSAGVDISFPDKGLLIPRVSLVSLNSPSPINNPAPGLMVFNTTMNSSVFPGVYTWYLNAWRKCALVGDSPNGNSNYIVKFGSGMHGVITPSAIFDTNNNIGIGTKNPTAKLEVNGSFRFTDNNQGAGKVLTSDANGRANWQDLPTSSGWSLTGNANTNPGVNFIGTTDPSPLDIRTNNTLKLRISYRGVLDIQNTGYSVFIGHGAGGGDDLVDNYNVFVGEDAGGHNSSGSYNTAVGSNTFSGNVTGLRNTVLGSYANVADGLTNATAIGFAAIAGASNTLVLGGTGPWAVNVGIGTTTPTAKLDVAGGNIKTDFQLVSTVGTGLAPLAVTSTTKVVNFNADKLDDLDAGGFIQNQTAADQAAGLRITGDALFNGGSVGIGTASPDASAALDITSTSKGFLMPRMTAVQIGNIYEPADGMAVYNTTDGYVYIYSAPQGSWKQLTYGSGAITTPATCGLINDARDGKTYHTIQLGTQCWMQQNLNVGTQVLASVTQTNNSVIEKYCYQDVAANCTTYGGMYQWDEMMQYVTTPGTQGICPDGWHLPTTAEFGTLLSYLNSNPSLLCNSTPGNTSTSLASKTLWQTSAIDCTPGNYPSSNNTTNFNGLPLGSVQYDSGTNLAVWSFFGVSALWWTSSESLPYGLEFFMNYNLNYAADYGTFKDQGIPVRCVKN